MPFTLVHGAISFFLLSFFTKDKRLWPLAFVAGMLPDIDGFPILWDMGLFRAIHHELLHPLIFGVALAIPAAYLLDYFFKTGRAQTLLVFAASFMLHPLTDVLFTNWPVPLFWPLTSQEFSYPVFIEYNWVLVLALPVMFAAPFAIGYLRNRNQLGGSSLSQNA